MHGWEPVCYQFRLPSLCTDSAIGVPPDRFKDAPGLLLMGARGVHGSNGRGTRNLAANDHDVLNSA
ncbi:hypothetical protein GCM10009539_03810 [Cryptosporangium japonicum]|uniref:Uncharacterized protein n=1 Tax=Cryptosporangium japonicum TaxID=80872 RepID=A0ABN0THK0_9ACTN